MIILTVNFNFLNSSRYESYMGFYCCRHLDHKVTIGTNVTSFLKELSEVTMSPEFHIKALLVTTFIIYLFFYPLHKVLKSNIFVGHISIKSKNVIFKKQYFFVRSIFFTLVT